jgi:acetoin utilization protein AcuC
MTRKAAFIYSDELSTFVLSDSHPMKPIRLQYVYELLRDYGIFDLPEASLVESRPVTDDEVLRFHKPEYLEYVKRVRPGDIPAFGFGPGDNPVSDGLYGAMAISAGGSMVAAELLASGEFDRAFSILGGLHHAMPGYASGFCVFNDPVLAIKELLARGMKVAYVDIDCHHGDGVQYAFYDTDAVLNISVHESGSFLFPGTGFVNETGTGKGTGYSVNLPLNMYTGDEVYLWAFRQVVPPLLEAFAPDVLVTQFGIDSHHRDPITHLGLTVQGFAETVADLADIAPKWLALGGGGYDLDSRLRRHARHPTAGHHPRRLRRTPRSHDTMGPQRPVRVCATPTGSPPVRRREHPRTTTRGLSRARVTDGVRVRMYAPA